MKKRIKNRITVSSSSKKIKPKYTTKSNRHAVREYYINKARKSFNKAKRLERKDYERYLSETDARDIGEINYLKNKIKEINKRKFSAESYIHEATKSKMLRGGKYVAKKDYETALTTTQYLGPAQQYAFWIKQFFPKSDIVKVRAEIARKRNLPYKTVVMPDILTMRYDPTDQKLHDDKTGFSIWIQYGVDSTEPDAVQWEVN